MLLAATFGATGGRRSREAVRGAFGRFSRDGRTPSGMPKSELQRRRTAERRARVRNRNARRR
jgi:hypothetical protein